MRARRVRSRLAPALARAAELAVAAGLVAAAAGPPLVAQSADRRPAAPSADIDVPGPGAPIVRAIRAGESHRYHLTAAAGDFLFVVIEQRGIDLAASLIDPGGREVAASDALDDSFRDETIAALAAAAGRYTVVVRPAPEAEPAGRYTLRVEELRPAGPEDAVRVEAERAFADAVRHRSRDRAETLPVALAGLETALAGYRQAADRRGELKTLIEIGATRYYLLQPEARAVAEAAEKMARDLGDLPALARTLRLLGNVLVWRGDFRAAAVKLDEANGISHALGNKRGEARGLNESGRVHRRLGELEQAVAAFERALPLARASNDRPMEAVLLGNLGLVYKLLGATDRARDAYVQSLASARARRDVRGQVTDLINLGNLDRASGAHARALKVHGEALSLARQAGQTASEAAALGAIGLTYHALGEYATALDYHRQSLAIRQRIGDRSGQAVALESAGRDLHALGDQAGAIAALEEALAIHRGLGHESGEADARRELAVVEGARGNLAAALSQIDAAVRLDEQLRGRITSPELRASYGSATFDKYEVFIDLLQRQHQADPAGGHAAAALQVHERARARVLLELLLEARVDLQQGIEPGLAERERALQQQLDEASSSLSRALARGAGAPERSAAARRVEQLSIAYQDLERQIRQRSPRYAAVMQPEPLSAAQIQRDVLDEDTVLLEFALGEQRSWLWAVTPDAITTVALPARRDVETAARSLYAQLTARQPRGGEAYAAYARRVAAADRRARQQSAAVSQMLLGGIATQLHGAWRGKRLVIVPAGALEYLPFAALPLPAAGGEAARGEAAAVPLIARHEVVAVPSASVVATLRREAAARPAPAPVVAVLADPVFARTDPRAPAARGVRRIEAAPAGGGVARLPFSLDEAAAIAALAGRDGVVTATGFAASRAAALGPAVSSARIVHFATHARLDNEHPGASGLILSLVDERGAPQDGFVRLHDIFNMRLSADLVVLSACQTALGSENRSEGLMGLTRGFMYAGAPRIVASLWQVSDVATAELMQRFYAGLLQRALPPAAALRAAQREMARDPRWASPYFWGGFVLQGEWRPPSGAPGVLANEPRRPRQISRAAPAVPSPRPRG